MSYSRDSRCNKWIRLTYEEFQELDDGEDPNVRWTGNCGFSSCQGYTKLFMLHVECGDYICPRCGKDVDIKLVCNLQERHRLNLKD
jgi:hypothetical protein